ncbi:MAG: hypothetical protein RL336_736, partial [Pseudomonadota bacterium]
MSLLAAQRDTAQAQLQTSAADLDDHRQRLVELREQAAVLQNKLDNERASSEQKLALLHDAQQQLR